MNGSDAIQLRGAVTRVARNRTTVFARLQEDSNQLFLHRVDNFEGQTTESMTRGAQVGATSDIDSR